MLTSIMRCISKVSCWEASAKKIIMIPKKFGIHEPLEVPPFPVALTTDLNDIV